MSVLDTIDGPGDLRRLAPEQLPALAQEIRAFLVESVSRTGGHLGPNLGVVELTIALHRVFDSPRDTVILDTGHQSYVHKLLTGRKDFARLRQRGGLSGYPSRGESEHDVVENSHASTALSWAEGVATARRLAGERDRHTVAVIGDGALTGGMAWEALNNIAADKDLPLVVVVNDNGRSYAPTTGGVANHLATLRTARNYERVLDWGKSTLARTPVVGRAAYETLHGMKKGLKDIVAPQGMFEDLGLKYLGPVDGHDVEALEHVLRRARDFGGPVLVHVLTQKGRGYQPARENAEDRFHAVGKINPETGLPLEVTGRSWTDEFSEELLAAAGTREDVVAITAAMLIPVGLKEFADAHPSRVFDVGIAEQHAVTMAAGMAFAGLHPVVAVYATFLNRAFDQLLMDCALHEAGVTFILDRAGVTGNDGASHNGMWDLSLASVVPGLRLAAPRDGVTLRRALREALDISDAPTALRFPKGNTPDPVPVVAVRDDLDVLHDCDGGPQVLVVSVGAMAPVALDAARRLAADGRQVRVVDPRWVLPVPVTLTRMAAAADLVVVVEDNVADTGITAAVAAALRASGSLVPVLGAGIPKMFLAHASRTEVLDEIGLTGAGVAERVNRALATRAEAATRD